MTQSSTYNTENGLKAYLSRTFSTMAIGVAISGIITYLFSLILPTLIVKYYQFYGIISIALVLVELGIAFYFSLNLMKMSKTTAWVCYILYSIVTGISFSSIIMTYTGASITLVFVSTTVMFICMSIIGHSSKINYTKVYSLFLPAIIAGLIISLLNTFIFHSSTIEMMIVFIGIVLFLGITAADVQKLKGMYYAGQGNQELSEKLMILGAFQLYLDFANIFLRILRLLGKRNND